MKQQLFTVLVAGALAASCVPNMQLAQNPVKNGPFTLRFGTGVDDTRCMIASSADRPLFVRLLVLDARKAPSERCPDLNGDGSCKSSKQVGREFFLTPGRERYFPDCNFMPDADGWDFQVFYEEAGVGAETVSFVRIGSASRPAPASIPVRSAPKPSNEPPPPTPTPQAVPPSAPAAPGTPPAPSP